MSRSTLAQQIAQLEDTAPDYDPEDAYDTTRASGVTEDVMDFEAADDGRAHYLDVGKSSLRKLHERVSDPKYSGVKTNRNKIFDDDEEDEVERDDILDQFLPKGDEDDENGDEDETMSQEGGDGEETEDEDEDEEGDGYRPAKAFGAVKDGSDDEAMSEDESASEKDDIKDAPEQNSVEGKSFDKSAVAEGDRQVADALRKSREQDRAKGKAIGRQISTWDSLLDARIRLQKSIVVANNLPLPESIGIFSSTDIGRIATHQFLEASLQLSEDLAELQSLYMSTNEDITPPPRKKRKVVTEPSSNDAWHAEFESQVREATIGQSQLEASYHRPLLQTLTKWSQKVQAVAPSALSSSFHRGAFSSSTNQNTAVDLIEETVSGGKAIARTRVRRAGEGGKRIGSTEGGDFVAQESLDVDEVFDDADFYQQLLRDVIESRTGKEDGVNVDAADAWARKQKKTQKAERALANKDKRVRYDIHEKLQNFMVPVSVTRGGWHEEQIDELFSSLLGKGFEGVAQDVEPRHLSALDATLLASDGTGDIDIVDPGLGGLRVF